MQIELSGHSNGVQGAQIELSGHSNGVQGAQIELSGYSNGVQGAQIELSGYSDRTLRLFGCGLKPFRLMSQATRKQRQPFVKKAIREDSRSR